MEYSDEMLPPRSEEESLQAVYDRETAERALAALAGLPVRAQQAFVLRYESGLKMEEIAGFLGVSLTTVKRYLNEARDALRRELTV